MLLKSLESRLADISLKDGMVTHYWSAFGNKDSDGDVIERGAYAKTIAERGPAGANRIKFLWQHDVWEPIGIPQELVEDEVGLKAVTKISPTAKGRDALILYEDGVLTEHSVGIDVIRRDEADLARILEVRLWEGSVVTWGANPLTPYLGMKGEASDAAWKRLASHLDGMQKALKRPLTDETAEQLELAVHALRAHMDGIQKQLRAAGSGGSAPPTDPAGAATGGDGAPRDEAEALELLINALGGQAAA